MNSMHIVKVLSAIVICTMFPAAVLGAETLADIQAEIKANSVNRRSKECRYYMAWYRELCTEAEREAILERNIAAHRRWIALAGKDGKDPKGAAMPRAELGKVLEIGGRWKEAEKELVEALKYDFDKERVVQARWALAECLWHRGDKDGAKRQIADIVAMNCKGGDSSPQEKARFLHRAWTDPDADLDALKLPHSIDCKPFPTPQKAEYGSGRLSLAKVDLNFRFQISDFKGAGDEDPIVRLLKRKMGRFGTKFEKGGTKVVLVISENAPVDKPQGYLLEVRGKREEVRGKREEVIGNGEVVIRARDRLGLVYGVVSFIQCIDRGNSEPFNPTIRTMRIVDWPKLERRGVVESFWKADFLEYALFNKMSSLVVKMDRPECGFLFSELDRERIRITIQRFRDFGIEPYWSAREITVKPALPFSSKRTRDLYLFWMRLAASYGCNICFEMDDERFFDFPEEDKKTFGSATNMDSKYITKLYRVVKRDFPEFRMTFGTPFYFGPDGGLSKSWYPEPRDEYLKSHREFLDPEIDVYWTGPRVKSAGFTVEKIKWMTDLIGRMPVVYHNSDCVGRHGHDSYGADVPGYKKSHCPETLDMIAGFYLNMTFYRETDKVGPAMDWCWNPDAHDAETATRRTLEQLEGPGVFEILSEATPPISYFDKYQYGQARSELMNEGPDHLEKLVSDGEKAWKRVLEIAKNGGMFVEGFNRLAVYYGRRLARYRRNPPKWLLEKVEAEKRNTKFATEDVGFDESKGDLFFPAEFLMGGKYHKTDDYSKRGKRGIKYVDVGTGLEAKFSCEPFPPEVAPRIFICGESFRKTKAVLEVELNGRTIWKGEAFDVHYFRTLEIEVPVHTLKRSGNKLVIRNASPESDSFRKFLIHYVVIRK